MTHSQAALSLVIDVAQSLMHVCTQGPVIHHHSTGLPHVHRSYSHNLCRCVVRVCWSCCRAGASRSSLLNSLSARCGRHGVAWRQHNGVRGRHLQVEQDACQRNPSMHAYTEWEQSESRPTAHSYLKLQRSTSPVPPCRCLAQGLAQAQLAAGGGRPSGARRWRARVHEEHRAQGLVQVQLATGGGERQLTQPSSASARRGPTSTISCKTQPPETEAGMQGRLGRYRCDAQVALRPGQHHLLLKPQVQENVRSHIALLCST